MFHELAINCRNFSFSKKGRSNCAGRRISIRKGGEAMGSLARSVVTCAYDANGNITEYVGMDGTILSHNDYSAFGRELIKTGSDDFTHRFSTKPLCHKTGVLEFQLRRYRPRCGRWMNRDAIEEDGGVNLYLYLSNNSFDIDFLGCASVGEWIMTLIGPAAPSGTAEAASGLESLGMAKLVARRYQLTVQIALLEAEYEQCPNPELENRIKELERQVSAIQQAINNIVNGDATSKKKRVRGGK